MAVIHLLLVDDEERFVKTTKALLERRGIPTLTALNGVEAMRTMDEHSVDVMVLDVRMPGVDGMEVLRKTKQQHPLVEVIMLTGHATVESAVTGLKLGAFDYVTKPCDMCELVQKVTEAHNRKRAMEEKIQKAMLARIMDHPMAVFGTEGEED